MPGIKYEMKGLRQLGENISRLKEDTRKKIAPAMTGAAANIAKKAAVGAAPQSDEPHFFEGVTIQPGNLKRNIIAVRVKKTDLTAEHVVTARSKEKGNFASRYGSMKEHGTVKMAAEPWLRPSFENSIQNAIEAMKKAGERWVLRASKKG